MPKLNKEQCRDAAVKIIIEHPMGIRYRDIVKKIHDENPETPFKTIQCIWDLGIRRPKEVRKLRRGVYAPAPRVAGEVSHEPPPSTESDRERPTRRPQRRGRRGEDEYYQAFAQYLKEDLGEVTEAVPLGGNVWGKKWATPDVIGVYRSRIGDAVPFNPEIVSAEIKPDTNQPIVAFGQAIAYRLFSIKTYVVLPDELEPAHQRRLEALCMLFGVGLVLFKRRHKNPQFTIRVRAQRFSPDMVYVNEFIAKLKGNKEDLFQKLFR